MSFSFITGERMVSVGERMKRINGRTLFVLFLFPFLPVSDSSGHCYLELQNK